MNWAAVAAIAAVLTLLVVLFGGGALWGTLTEKVSGVIHRVDNHGKQIALLDGRLNGVDVELGRLQEWKSGYNAAARVGGKTPEV